MILFAAIDLKQGRCVRLDQGRMSRATVFSDDPAGQARGFVGQGFSFLHVIDLDGAVGGVRANDGALEAILGAAAAGGAVRIQAGGGIRTEGAIESWLGRGVWRVILGTAALSDPGFAKRVCRRFAGRIVIALDSRAGRVALEGWTRLSALTTLEAARRFADCGPAALLYTDILRDGRKSGINLRATAELAEAAPVPVIASGGLSGLADLKALGACPGIEGVVAGRALYDGRLDARAALAALAAEGAAC